jgi:hypothetical protein
MDTPEQPPSQKPARFFDIVPANKTKPDNSSRPIITNQPPQNDPMMKVQAAPAPVAPKAQSVSEPSQITVAEALDTASEPIKLDEPSAAESTPSTPPPAEESAASEPVAEIAATSKASKDSAVKPDPNVVVGHGGRAHPIRDLMTILLILALIVVIADLLLDLNILKFALPHSHYFGG